METTWAVFLGKVGRKEDEVKGWTQEILEATMDKLGYSLKDNPIERGDIYTKWRSLQAKRKAEDDGDKGVKKQKSVAGIEAFWNALQSATEANNMIALSNANWFGKTSLGSQLFVRRSYKDLWDIIWGKNQAKPRETNGFVVSGNPGIGKTWFLGYILFQLKKAGVVRVVLELKREGLVYLFNNSGVEEASSELAFREYLNDSDTWYLVDGKLPFDRNAFTLLTTSPRPGNYKEFAKRSDILTVWMPVWLLDEIQFLRATSSKYAHLTQREIHKLFAKWGGIPRYVLDKAKDKGAQEDLEKAIATSDLKRIKQAIGALDSQEDITHKVIHVVVGNGSTSRGLDYYQTTHISFGSIHIGRRVAELMAIQSKEELKMFLASSDGLGALGALRGILLEGYAHNILQQGGTFKVRNLHDPTRTVSTITLPKRKEKIIYELTDIKKLADKYGRPVISNFESIDSVLTSGQMFQMTVAKTHPVKTHGVLQVLKELNLKANKCSHYFVLPPDRFVKYGEQNFVNVDDTITKKPPAVVQFALELPIGV